MSGVKLRSLEISNFLMFGDKVILNWVDDPLDYDEPTPDKIGFCGMNGTGKSTALSRALTWLFHPISNSIRLPSDQEPNGCFNDLKGSALQVTAIVEFNGDFFRASRWLFPTDLDGDFSLDQYPKDGGKPVPRKGAWDHVFGEDGGSTHFLPYIWENENLARAAASMGSKGGLRQFSENLGAKEMIRDLDILSTTADDAWQTAADAHLDDEKLAMAKKLALEANQIEEDIKSLRGEVRGHKNTDNEFVKQLAKIGGDFNSVTKNIGEEENAAKLAQQTENAWKLSVLNQKKNRALRASACAAISDHIESRYGDTKADYPEEAAPASEKAAADDFKNNLTELYSELADHSDSDVQRIVAEINRLADSGLSFDLAPLHISDSALANSVNKDLLDRHDAWSLSRVKHLTAQQNLIVESGTLSPTDYSKWKTARQRIQIITPEISKLTRDFNQRKQFRTQITDNDSASTELTLQASKIRLINHLNNAIESVVSNYEHNARASMIEIASNYLERLSTTSKFTLELEDEKVMPYEGTEKRDLAMTDQQGGPSSGQGRAIANMVMLSRYEMINCSNPLILDDAFEKIDTHTKPALFNFVLDKVEKMGNQIIWVQQEIPFSRADEFSLIFGLPVDQCKVNGWLDIAPWDGEPLSPKSMTFEDWDKRCIEISKSNTPPEESSEAIEGGD
jgi:hypothetical protein